MILNNRKEIEKFSSFLKEKGLKITKQRMEILKQILYTDDHFDTEEIFEKLRKRKLRVSRATVYRALAHIENCSLIRKLNLGNGRSFFEKTSGKEHHEHIYCTQCGKIIEFSDTIMENRIKKLSGFNGFKITNHNFQIFGICDDCRRNMELKEKEDKSYK